MYAARLPSSCFPLPVCLLNTLSCHALQLLRGHGVPLHRDAVRAAARGGHAACVAWLVEQLGPAHALSADVARDATCAADTALMAWLRQVRGSAC